MKRIIVPLNAPTGPLSHLKPIAKIMDAGGGFISSAHVRHQDGRDEAVVSVRPPGCPYTIAFAIRLFLDAAYVEP